MFFFFPFSFRDFKSITYLRALFAHSICACLVPDYPLRLQYPFHLTGYPFNVERGCEQFMAQTEIHVV